MNTVFVIKNQHGLYFSKQQEWVSGADGQTLFRTPHKDEAINTVFEVSSRDIHLRAEAIACELDAKGYPQVEVTAAPLAPSAEPETETEASEDSLPA